MSLRVFMSRSVGFADGKRIALTSAYALALSIESLSPSFLPLYDPLGRPTMSNSDILVDVLLCGEFIPVTGGCKCDDLAIVGAVGYA